MKRIDFYYWVTVALVAAALLLPAKPAHKNKLYPHITPPSQVTKEQRTTHFIEFQDERSDSVSICTATSVGPHALLTAEHCLKNGDATQLVIDYTLETHSILAVAGDGRDHVLLLIDGSPLRNIEPINAGTAQLNDVLTIYGDGGALYPPIPKYGRAVDCQDPSDIDVDAGILCTTIPVIGGDSGSAIYNSKGEIVGLTTYAVAEAPYTNIDFALNFTSKEISQAVVFDGKKDDLPGAPENKAPKKKKELTLLDLFGIH